MAKATKYATLFIPFGKLASPKRPSFYRPLPGGRSDVAHRLFRRAGADAAIDERPLHANQRPMPRVAATSRIPVIEDGAPERPLLRDLFTASDRRRIAPTVIGPCSARARPSNAFLTTHHRRHTRVGVCGYGEMVSDEPSKLLM
jgi:hypothetical protein